MQYRSKLSQEGKLINGEDTTGQDRGNKKVGAFGGFYFHSLTWFSFSVKVAGLLDFSLSLSHSKARSVTHKAIVMGGRRRIRIKKEKKRIRERERERERESG